MDYRDYHVGGLIKLISDRLRSSSDANLKPWGLTFQQCRVLGYLDDHGGSATQKAIEEHLQVTHPTVVGIVSRLEKNGFITSRLHDEDKRIKIVETTQRANALRDDIWRDRCEREKIMVSGISEEELDQLKQLLYRIYRNIDTEKGGKNE